MLVDRLDRVLAYLFATRVAKWLAVQVLHIPPERCNLCYSRVRWAQFCLWATQQVPDRWLHERRLRWKVRANPLPDGFTLAGLIPIARAAPPAQDEFVDTVGSRGTYTEW